MLSLLLACDGEPAAPPPPRFESVTAPAAAAVDLDVFCEVRPPADQAPAFAWPALSAASPPAPPKGEWTWVNVWATWCAPCIAEMPTIITWPQTLADRGTPIALRLLSVDEDAGKLTAFTRTHPEVQGSLHMADGARAADWIATLGLPDVSPALPLHLLVDPQGRTRCARSGALDHDHLGAIEAVIRQSP
jgi:thiol-disulfide isomerase/thioredoxin